MRQRAPAEVGSFGQAPRFPTFVVLVVWFTREVGMDKPAYVVLQFDKSSYDYGFWWGIIKTAAKKSVHEKGDLMVVSLLVKSYSMEDHQFILLKTDIERLKEKEIQFWIPRNFVKTIIESKTDLSAAFTFAGSTDK
jgi:hypothetical protein